MNSTDNQPPLNHLLAPPPDSLELSAPSQSNSTVPIQRQHERVNPPLVPISIVEQLAQMADKSEIMSLLKFKEEQQLDKNDPLWAFLLEFKTIENSVNKQEEILNLLINGFETKFTEQIEAHQQRIDTSFSTYSQDLINQYKILTDNTTDTATTSIFFRFCVRQPVDLGCTPYFIGPIPFFPANRDSWIILGPGF